MKISARENRKNAILNSATEILSLKPTATLQEIADYAIIGIATLHRYFPTREVLLDALAINAVELVEAALNKVEYESKSMNEILFQIFDLLIPLGNKVSFLSSAASVDENPEVVSGERKLKDNIIFSIEKWKNEGLIKKNMSSKWMVDVMYQLLFVTWQAIQEGEIARKDAPGLLLETVLNGFSENKM